MQACIRFARQGMCVNMLCCACREVSVEKQHSHDLAGAEYYWCFTPHMCVLLQSDRVCEHEQHSHVGATLCTVNAAQKLHTSGVHDATALSLRGEAAHHGHDGAGARVVGAPLQPHLAATRLQPQNLVQVLACMRAAA